jgi:hypothetical protein
MLGLELQYRTAGSVEGPVGLEFLDMEFLGKADTLVRAVGRACPGLALRMEKAAGLGGAESGIVGRLAGRGCRLSLDTVACQGSPP